MISLLIFALIVLLVCAVLIWAVQSFLPGDPTLKGVACFVIVVIGVLVVLQRSGVV